MFRTIAASALVALVSSAGAAESPDDRATTQPGDGIMMTAGVDAARRPVVVDSDRDWIVSAPENRPGALYTGWDDPCVRQMPAEPFPIS